MNNIIDNPMDLISLSPEDLNELLLEPKYNKQNLKELCIRCIQILNGEIAHKCYLKRELDLMKQNTNKIKELLQCQE